MEKKIYIIIGAVVGIVVLLFLTYCCCRRKKKTNHQQQAADDHSKNNPGNASNQSQVEVSSRGGQENGQSVSTICNLEQTISPYIEDLASADSIYPGSEQWELRFQSISPTTIQDDDLNRRPSGLQLNIALAHKSQERALSTSDAQTYSPGFPPAAHGSVETTGTNGNLPDLYPSAITQDPRFYNLVSNQVRDELNQILKKDSFKSAKKLTPDSPSPVHPSQLKEFSGNLAKREQIHPKVESPKVKPESQYPRIPQPDYGTVSPAAQPYKRREFKGPYGAEDLDDMNNPYTLKRGKHKRLSVQL